MILKQAQFCDDPKKYPQNLHTPKKYSFFWKPKKILKFRILNPKKWAEPTYVGKYQSTPPGDLRMKIYHLGHKSNFQTETEVTIFF